MFFVSLILLLGFPFLYFSSSFNLLFLRPNFLKSSSSDSCSLLSFSPCLPLFLGNIDIAPILSGSYCLGLNFSFSQSRALVLEVLAQWAFSRVKGKLVERSHLLLGGLRLSLYWSSILYNLGRCYYCVRPNLPIGVHSKVSTVQQAEPHIQSPHKQILID